MIDLSKLDYCPLKPCVTFQLKPSLGSAFLPLQQTARMAVTDDDDDGVLNGEVSPSAAAITTSSSSTIQPPPVPQLQGMGVDNSAAPCSNDHNNDHAGM